MAIPQLETIKLQWKALPERDRRMLTIAITCLVAFLLYALLWMPMQKRIKQLRVSLPAAQQKLSLMQIQAAQIKRLKGRMPQVQKSGSLLTLLEKSTTIRGLRHNMTKLEPDGKDGVRLNLEEVQFDTLFNLLADLQKKNGLKVSSATVDRFPDSPGVVNAHLVLRRDKQ